MSKFSLDVLRRRLAQVTHVHVWQRIDLIAMCTHGRTGLARWTFGSVADRVLRAGSTPILLVRAR